MEKKPYSISGLYYRYKRIDDERLRKLIELHPLVRLENKGPGTIQGYYPLNSEAKDKLLNGLRKKSLTFDVTETADKPLSLREYKRITYLVKSSSRFFLKPDIGEVFDQLEYDDLYDSKFKAILFLDGHELLPDTDGEHFLMEAVLMTDK